MITIPWYGSKSMHLDFIIGNLRPSDRTPSLFVDVFGGSAAVSLHTGHLGYTNRVYNDIDGDVVQFFRVLRDDGNRLLHQISLTPYSRREMEIACRRDRDIGEIERARRFFVRVNSAIMGLGQYATASQFRTVTPSTKDVIPKKTRVRIENLSLVVERLRDIVIENMTAMECIRKFDDEGTLFYCDPPYVMDARSPGSIGYTYEMTDDDHRDLASALRSAKGNVAVSGYDSDLYNELYEGWNKVVDGEKKLTVANGRGTDKTRREVLWTNYETGQRDLGL